MRIHRNSYYIRGQVAKICQIFKTFAARGWCDATSTNISVRCGNEVLISRSGGAKESYGDGDFLRLPLSGPMGQGEPVAQPGARPSAETPLHLAIYRKLPSVGAVIHTHSLACTLLSELSPALSHLQLPALEMAKGIKGVADHHEALRLPIFANSQDMVQVGEEFTAYQSRGAIEKGLILRGHGLYAYGADLAEAKGHVETYEYLLAYLYQLKTVVG